MAEVVEGPPRRRTFYPWESWMDGQTHRAKSGEDYTCSDVQFQNALHQRARATKKKVTTGSPERGVVEFQFADV